MCVQILLARWLASPPAGRATVSLALGDDDRLKILQARAAAGSSNTNGLPAFSLPQAVACHFVDGADGVTRLAGAFEALEADGGELGFDTEWRPASLYDGCPALPAAGSGPSLLQLATRSEVFVVDLLAIGADHAAAARFRRALDRALCAEGVQVLGFACKGDLAQLERSGWLAGRSRGEIAPRDLQSEASAAGYGVSRRQPGLKSLVAQLLGSALDKSLTLSDWAARPLSDAQIEYAAADAWVLLPLADALATLAPPPSPPPPRLRRRPSGPDERVRVASQRPSVWRRVPPPRASGCAWRGGAVSPCGIREAGLALSSPSAVLRGFWAESCRLYHPPPSMNVVAPS